MSWLRRAAAGSWIRRLRRVGLWLGALSAGVALFGVASAAGGRAAVAGEAHGGAPKVPQCYYTGTSAIGQYCEGLEFARPESVALYTVPEKGGVFKLAGPAPLQFTKQVACGSYGCLFNTLAWKIAGDVTVVSGCRPNTSVCEVRVAPSAAWSPVFVNQNGENEVLFLLWNSSKTDGATISGYVRDTQKQGVAGVAVGAYGTGGTFGGSRDLTDTAGFYTMDVKAGSYRVIPTVASSGKGPPSVEPASVELSVSEGAAANVDFTLEAGLQVTLTLSRTSVAADGFTVVQGKVETTEFGKPKGGVTVSLRPKTDVTPDAAVTTGARATICTPTGTRIWPAGTLSSPLGEPVDIVTNPDGVYTFTMTIGTVPGTFELGAWARDAAGGLITNDPRASDDVTLTIAAPSTMTITNFLEELDSLAMHNKQVSDTLAATTSDPASLATSLSQLSGPSSSLGGIAYSLVNSASGGGAVLAYQDTSPPKVSATGQVIAGQNTLVFAPGQWVGVNNGVILASTAFNVVLGKGKLLSLPTFAEWASGASAQGWKLTTNSASLISQNFEYNGWPYPAARSGACN